jgi:hypothetical protein
MVVAACHSTYSFGRNGVPDNKTFVLAKHPKAAAQHLLAVKERGQTRDTGGGTWLICVAPGRENELLGSGTSEQAAWADAALKISKPFLGKDAR